MTDVRLIMTDTDRILLTVARHCNRVTPKQLHALEVLELLSDGMYLDREGDSKTEGATCLTLSVSARSAAWLVDVEWDGSIQLTESIDEF